MKILLTGASSYIAKYVANKLLEDGYIIDAISRTNPKINHINYNWVSLDITKDEIKNDNIDFIIHMAAQSRLNKSASEYFDSNLLITNNIAKYAKKIKPKGILYTSSIKVYGDILDEVVSETTSMINQDLYGMSKYYGEKLLEDISPTISLRMPGVIANNSHGWINNIYEKLINNSDIKFFSSPYNHIVHAYDIYNSFKLLMEGESFKTNQYNICSSDILTSKEVIALLKQLINSESNLIEINDNKIGHILSNEKLTRIYKPMSLIGSLELYIKEREAII